MAFSNLMVNFIFFFRSAIRSANAIVNCISFICAIEMQWILKWRFVYMSEYIFLKCFIQNTISEKVELNSINTLAKNILCLYRWRWSMFVVVYNILLTNNIFSYFQHGWTSKAILCCFFFFYMYMHLSGFNFDLSNSKRSWVSFLLLPATLSYDDDLR